jgi:YesN/AraC family two-component response regulator
MLHDVYCVSTKAKETYNNSAVLQYVVNNISVHLLELFNIQKHFTYTHCFVSSLTTSKRNDHFSQYINSMHLIYPLFQLLKWAQSRNVGS